ncbi:MAG: Omp28-related outer membrane protein [Fluviicola sp.]
MKKILFVLAVGAFLFASCDKVENPYPAQEDQGDYSLYPGGDSATYWATDGPVFGANPNTQRNIVIEDFTGHKCNSCPIAADTAEQLHDENPSRVFVATIHAGPQGMGGFQQTDGTYTIDWTNSDGLDIGFHFGNLPGSQFVGNPSGTVNRILTNGQHTISPLQWRNSVEAALPTALKVNIQSAANYYASTRGMFLHTEIDVLDQSITDDLYTVVYLIEDTIVGPQKMPNNTDNLNYVHKEVMRDCIQSDWQGKQLTSANEVAAGKYRFDYIFELPSQYDPANMHLLIYVRNAATEEIYHVVKQKFID